MLNPLSLANPTSMRPACSAAPILLHVDAKTGNNRKPNFCSFGSIAVDTFIGYNSVIWSWLSWFVPSVRNRLSLCPAALQIPRRKRIDREAQLYTDGSSQETGDHTSCHKPIPSLKTRNKSHYAVRACLVSSGGCGSSRESHSHREHRKRRGYGNLLQIVHVTAAGTKAFTW